MNNETMNYETMNYETMNSKHFLRPTQSKMSLSVVFAFQHISTLWSFSDLSTEDASLRTDVTVKHRLRCQGSLVVTSWLLRRLTRWTAVRSDYWWTRSVKQKTCYVKNKTHSVEYKTHSIRHKTRSVEYDTFCQT